MNKIACSVLDLIGNTPMIRLNKLVPEGAADVYAKAEFLNPAGSVKDRICLNMILEAEQSGKITPGKTTIIEPTSGNTGIGLAMVCAVKGYKLILTMPDSMSLERRALLKRFGADVVLTPALDGMDGAVKKARELQEAGAHSFMPLQFDSPANPQAHRNTTAREILDQLGRGIDALVAAVGTGGTITGVGEVLKEAIPSLQIIAVEPAQSPVLSGGKPGLHNIQGTGAGFIPNVLNTNLYDRIIQVRDEDAYAVARQLCRREGLLTGISSGANVFAAIQVAKGLGHGKTVVTVLCDTGERYMSLDQ